jgi:hypothetical protein
MWIEDHVVALVARERMQEAVRSAKETKAIRRAGVPRRPARVCLGTALVRLGRWIMGPHLSDSGGPIVSGASR